MSIREMIRRFVNRIHFFKIKYIQDFPNLPRLIIGNTTFSVVLLSLLITLGVYIVAESGNNRILVTVTALYASVLFFSSLFEDHSLPVVDELGLTAESEHGWFGPDTMPEQPIVLTVRDDNVSFQPGNQFDDDQVDILKYKFSVYDKKRAETYYIVSYRLFHPEGKLIYSGSSSPLRQQIEKEPARRTEQFINEENIEQDLKVCLLDNNIYDNFNPEDPLCYLQIKVSARQASSSLLSDKKVITISLNDFS